MRPGGMVIWLDDVAESRRGAARPPWGLRRGGSAVAPPGAPPRRGPAAGGLRRGSAGAPPFVSFTRGACPAAGGLRRGSAGGSAVRIVYPWRVC